MIPIHFLLSMSSAAAYLITQSFPPAYEQCSHLLDAAQTPRQKFWHPCITLLTRGSSVAELHHEKRRSVYWMKSLFLLPWFQSVIEVCSTMNAFFKVTILGHFTLCEIISALIGDICFMHSGNRDQNGFSPKSLRNAELGGVCTYLLNDFSSSKISAPATRLAGSHCLLWPNRYNIFCTQPMKCSIVNLNWLVNGRELHWFLHFSVADWWVIMPWHVKTQTLQIQRHFAVLKDGKIDLSLDLISGYF